MDAWGLSVLGINCMDDNLVNRNVNRGFRKLDIWKIAIEIYFLVHEILHKKSKISFKVKAQIEDSALSISSNIAEGYSRRSIKENLRFYEIDLGSVAENYSQMFAIQNTNQISREDFDIFDNKIYELENKVISMNKDMISKIKTNTCWKTEYE